MTSCCLFINSYVTMFLLVSLLFVTAAVLVDKPESMLDLQGFHASRPHRGEKQGADKEKTETMLQLRDLHDPYPDTRRGTSETVMKQETLHYSDLESSEIQGSDDVKPGLKFYDDSGRETDIDKETKDIDVDPNLSMTRDKMNFIMYEDIPFVSVKQMMEREDGYITARDNHVGSGFTGRSESASGGVSLLLVQDNMDVNSGSPDNFVDGYPYTELDADVGREPRVKRDVADNERGHTDRSCASGEESVPGTQELDSDHTEQENMAGFNHVYNEGISNEDSGVNASDKTSSDGVFTVGITKEILIRKHKKTKGRALDPWVFEREIGPDPDVCFNRLSLAKYEIEEYAHVSSSESRLNEMKMTILDTNYTQLQKEDRTIFKRSTETEDPHDPKYSDMAVEQAPSMSTSQNSIPDCHFLFPYKRQWIKLVASCPKSWGNATIEHLCVPHYRDIKDDNTIDLLSQPVQDAQGMVFRNIFCAQCNQASNVQAWDVVVLCDGTSSLFFIDGNVLMTLMPKLTAAPRCRKSLWPRQPEKVETCLITKRSAAGHYPGSRRRTYDDERVTYPVSFSVLMNFGFDGKTHILFSTTHEEVESETGQPCPRPDQIYDYRSRQCRTYGCPEGYKLVGDECLTDDMSGQMPSTDELLPNVQTLTHLPDVAVITLIVNATYSNLLAVASPGFKTTMVEGIATLFNISSERIQNFTIDRVDSSNPGPEVAVNTLDEKPVIEPAKNLAFSSQDGDFPSEEGPGKVTAMPKTRKTQNDRPDHTPSTKGKYSSSVAPRTEFVFSSAQQNQMTSPHRQIVTDKVDIFDDKKKKHFNVRKHSPASHHEKRRPSTTPSVPPEQILDLLNEKTISLRLKFLILPARSSMLNEGSVSSIKEKMNNLFRQKKFTLSLNGTYVTVVSMVDKDHDDMRSTSCSKGQMQFYFADELDIINAKDSSGNTVTHVMVNATNSIYGPGKFDLTLWMTGNVGSETNLTDVMGYAFVCVMPRIAHVNCPIFTLTQKEYKLLPNKSILWGERLRNMAEYQYVDEAEGLIQVCVPESILHPNITDNSSIWVIHGCGEGFDRFVTAEGYMTAILGRISIVALAMVFLTYCLFPRLRNLPGVNTMNLTLALLIAESIFITGERTMDPPWLCSLVAISLHYFFLAAFFWMNVMSFDVFRTFANQRYVLPHIREKSKYLCRYILYCWGSPAVIVCVCVILDFTKIIPGVEIGYGYHDTVQANDQGNNTLSTATNNSTNATGDRAGHVSTSLGCWIHKPIATLTAFGAPMMIILLINIYLFVKTILQIRKTAKFTMDNTRRSSVNKRTGRNDVILYVRMSTVMGFTWVFGLASSVVSVIADPPSNVVCYTEHILEMLFVIFNCSQGLFIFFAFVCKRRVFYLYKGLWIRILSTIKLHRTGIRHRHTSGSNTSTSSTSSSTTVISTIS